MRESIVPRKHLRIAAIALLMVGFVVARFAGGNENLQLLVGVLLLTVLLAVGVFIAKYPTAEESRIRKRRDEILIRWKQLSPEDRADLLKKMLE